MHLRLTPQYVVAVALAAVALLASTATARPLPPDLRAEAATSSLAGTHAPRQDLRGEHARDAAAHPRVLPPTTVAPAEPKPLPPADTDGGTDTWLILLAGLAGAGIVAAGTTTAVRARRVA